MEKGAAEGLARSRCHPSLPSAPCSSSHRHAGEPCLAGPYPQNPCCLLRSQQEGRGACGAGFPPCNWLLLHKKEVACLTQAKKTLVLLPHVAELLQDADNDAASDASAMALSVLSNMLQMLEGPATSLTALQLAPKLRPLFDDVSPHVDSSRLGLLRGDGGGR